MALPSIPNPQLAFLLNTSFQRTAPPDKKNHGGQGRVPVQKHLFTLVGGEVSTS